MKFYSNESGLTLVELLAIIIILAIIAVIAIPSFQLVINNQRDKAFISDITALVSTARMSFADSSCEDLICEYSVTNNELNFSSTKFDKGTVDFTNGTSFKTIKINVNIDPEVFKGRNAPIYKALISQTGGFTEEDLLDALTK